MLGRPQENQNETDADMTRRRAIQLIGAGLLMGREVLAGSAEPAEASEGQEKPERHERLVSDQGPVHVWHPAHKGTLKEAIIFVKGDGCTVDRTWERDHLADQFRASFRRALFIAPDSPIDGWKDRYNLQWGGDLTGLMDYVKAETGVDIPKNVTAIGHSAGYRTISTWLDSGNIRDVILSDALYGRFGTYRKWIEQEGNRLTLVRPMGNAFTEKQTKNFLNNYRRRNGKEAVQELDEDIELLSRNEISQSSKIISLRSHYRHADQIRKGKVIPAVLKLLNKSIKIPQI